MEEKKVIQVSGFDDDGRTRLVIKGLSEKMHFIDGEAEDGNLSRDFSDCFGIFSALQEVYKAGKNGTIIIFEEIQDNDISSDNYEK